jgi:hypothetical protein
MSVKYTSEEIEIINKLKILIDNNRISKNKVANVKEVIEYVIKHFNVLKKYVKFKDMVIKKIDEFYNNLIEKISITENKEEGDLIAQTLYSIIILNTILE